MTKLSNIKGYWDSSYTFNFDNVNMWEGKILLEDDGWFEGVVTDPNSFYTGDRFIFGVYHPDKVIELFKFSPENVSSPFVFHGAKEVKGYGGEFEVIGLLGTTPCGVSHIITQEAELNRGNVDLEIEELKERIQKYKDNNFDEDSKIFYDNSVAQRNCLCQIILRNYEGIGFTDEEISKMREEYGTVNERVISATDDAVKKLIKTMSDDDIDLPFC